MRATAVFLCWIQAVCMSYGQGSAGTVFFNEVSISVNRTVLANDNTTDLFGCGIGLTRVVFNRRGFFLVSGLEYNFTRQLKDRTYEGHFARAEDVTYSLHFLTIPLTLRYELGRRVRFFLETGGFLDLMLHSSRSGTWCSYLPVSGAPLTFDRRPFEQNAGVSNPNYGFLAGLGIRIPVEQKGYLVVKSDYRLGFNELSTDEDIHNCYVRFSVGWNGLFRNPHP